MYDVLEKGGYVMMAIISCSIVAVTIVIERWLYYRQQEKNNKVFMAYMEETFADNGLIKENDSALARLWRNLMGGKMKPETIAKNELEIFLAAEALHLEKYLYILATIATIAPLLGLLGTVMGMIKTFHFAAAAGISNPGLLAEGISEALYNTAAGLCVTILCIISNNHYRNRIERMLQNIELESNKLSNLMVREEL